MTAAALLLLAIVGCALAGAALLSLDRRSRARARMWREAEHAPVRDATPRAIPAGRIGRWLHLAGYRDPRAIATFGFATRAAALVGLACAVLLSDSPALRAAQLNAAAAPAVGSALAGLVGLSPWLAALGLAAAPALVVSSARKRLVQAIEGDLPLTLELLATLAEAGMGFDAAIQEVLASQREPGPLGRELRIYRTEQLTGLGRVACLRRLSERISVRAVRAVVAALVQAEETGAGLAQVLRPLADDLRLRNRERALARAEALPEKLVFPLIAGFLPGMLVWTLGPAVHQLVQVIGSITS